MSKPNTTKALSDIHGQLIAGVYALKYIADISAAEHSVLNPVLDVIYVALKPAMDDLEEML